MKNFRHIALLVMTTALAAGCVKTELAVKEKEVIFSVGSRALMTKAVEEVTEFDSFSSKGYLHAEGVAGVQDFFGAAGETITKTDVGGGEYNWLPSHIYYWPKHNGSYVNFVSWYDNGTPAPAVTETSITWTNRTVGTDDNILVANKAWYQKANVQNYFTPGVPTLFKHLLAKVTVRAKSTIESKTVGDVETAWTLKISDFQLHNVYTSGSLSLTNTTPPADSESLKITEWTGDWTITGTTTDVPGPAGSTTLGASDYTNVVAMRSVLPQAVADIYMSFKYEVTTTTTNSVTHSTHTFTESVDVANLALNTFTGYTGDWVMNKIITYNININPETGAIVIIPVADTWTSASKEIMVE